MNQQRDRGITRIYARPGRLGSGMGLGIMLVDEVYPGFPGDVRNPSAYPFPIQYDVVAGVDIYALCTVEDKSPCLEPILDAARRLERFGAERSPASVATSPTSSRRSRQPSTCRCSRPASCRCPGCSSSSDPVGTSESLPRPARSLTETHLRNVGVDPDSNIVIAGAMDEYERPEFDSLWEVDKRPEIPTSDFATAEADMVRICRDFVSRNPSIRAPALECTGFQPFAQAIQREIDIPVASFSTLLDYAYSLAVHRDFYGHV